jgi:hypothetical protein
MEKGVHHYFEWHIWVPELIQLMLPHNQEHKKKPTKPERA